MKIKLIDHLASRIICWMIIVSCLAFIAPVTSAKPLPKIRIAVIEGGAYPQMESFRAAFYSQLQGQTAGEYEIVFLPNAYLTAEWNRATSKKMAQALSKATEVDIILALGPWVVQDLLEANCQLPIIAVHQFDPVGAGLLTMTGRPIADNLALGYDPNRIRKDLERIKGYSNPSKLGLLYFPDGGTEDSTVRRVSRIAAEMGMAVVTTDGFDNNGTFAFFKAFRSLPHEIEALYLAPLWGLSTTKTAPFFEMVKKQRLPLFSFDGRFQVTRGAMVGFGSDNLIAEAFFHADQVVQIMRGSTPADLPVIFKSSAVLTVNEALLSLCEVDLPRITLLKADRIGRSQVPGGEYFNLKSAIAQALAADARLSALGQKLDLAKIPAAQLRTKQLPQVKLEGSLGWVSDNTIVNSFDEVKKSQRHIALRLEQSILNSDLISQGGLTSLRLAMTKSQLDSARADLKESVTQAYYGYFKIMALEELLKEYRRRLDLFDEFSVARQQLSSTQSADHQRWQFERSRATRLIFQAETAREQAKTIFNLLLSQPAQTKINLDSLIVGNSQLVTEFSAAQKFIITDETQRAAEIQLLELARELRPALKAGKLKLDEVTQQLKRHRFSYLPDIGLEASIGWADSLADRPGTFQEEPESWSAGLRFDWPLFKGGERSVKRRRLRGWLDQTEYEADATLLTVVREVKLSAQSWFAALPIILLNEEAQASANDYLLSMTELYLSGQTGSTEMTVALDSWLEAGLDGLDGRFEYYNESAKLLRAIGGSMAEQGDSPGQAILWYLANQK